MKTKLTLVISALALLVASCGSLQSFEKRKYMKGFYVSVTDNKQQTELLSNNKEEKQTEVKETISDTVPDKKNTEQVLVISDKVGNVIDSTEKAKYHLFPYWENKDFQSAQFIQEPDGKIYVVGTMKDGRVKKMPVTQGTYNQLQQKTFGDTSFVKQLTEEEKIAKQKKRDNTKRIAIIIITSLLGLTEVLLLILLIGFGWLASTSDIIVILSLLIGILFLIALINGAFTKKNNNKTAFNKTNSEKDLDDDYEEALLAKKIAIWSIAFMFLFFPVGIALAIIAIKKGKKIMNRHGKDENYNGKDEAEFAYRVGRKAFTFLGIILSTILLISLLLLYALGEI